MNKKERFAVLLLALVVASWGALQLVLLGGTESNTQAYTGQPLAVRYMFLYPENSNEFSDSILEGAKNAAVQENIALELVSYASEKEFSESMKSAVAAKVDGVLCCPDTNANESIQYVFDQGIPVVTVLEDAPSSARMAFVGVNSYELGKRMGQLLSELDDTGSIGVIGGKERANTVFCH